MVELIIRSSEFRYVSETEMVEGLASYKAVSAQCIVIKHDSQEITTNAFVITFGTCSHTAEVRAEYIQVAVSPYIPNQLRCFSVSIRSICIIAIPATVKLHAQTVEVRTKMLLVVRTLPSTSTAKKTPLQPPKIVSVEYKRNTSKSQGHQGSFLL